MTDASTSLLIRNAGIRRLAATWHVCSFRLERQAAPAWHDLRSRVFQRRFVDAHSERVITVDLDVAILIEIAVADVSSRSVSDSGKAVSPVPQRGFTRS